jgi:hypothetical protein
MENHHNCAKPRLLQKVGHIYLHLILHFRVQRNYVFQTCVLALTAQWTLHQSVSDQITAQRSANVRVRLLFMLLHTQLSLFSVRSFQDSLAELVF